MAKKNKKAVLIFLGLAIAMIFILPKTGLFATVNTATMTRGVPTTVTPGQQFIVTYTPSGTPSGNWFVAWEDSVSGGCSPSNYKAFLANGGTGSTTFTAPASGSCTFTGYYQYTGGSQVNFASQTVTVYVCQPVCTRPANMCTEGASVSDTCTGTCTGKWTVTKKTDGDSNCDNSVSFTELTTYANSWVAGSATFTQLISVANAWAA